MSRFAISLVSLLVLAGCAGGDRKAAEPGDGPSGRMMTAAEVKDAVPRREPRSRYGNHSPYTVLGKQYTVMESAAGYREVGLASWYGSKFHGRRTSSGEPYDMHLATAAHKRLPLPTYAEVTNLDNGRKVIVKVNDRGPFHDNRIIDLSYAAAIKLGMADRGTARVEVRAITLDETAPSRVSGKLETDTWLQAGAFRSRSSARNLADTLERARLDDVSVRRTDGLYKVWLGPFKRAEDLEAVARRVVELGFDRPHKVTR